MGSITEVLRSDQKPDAKLAAIVKIVAEVRKGYGNADTDIPMPEMETASGVLPLSALTTETRLELANVQVQHILSDVLESSKFIPGLNVEKFVESKIAVNDILVNLGVKVAFGAL